LYLGKAHNRHQKLLKKSVFEDLLHKRLFKNNVYYILLQKTIEKYGAKEEIFVFCRKDEELKFQLFSEKTHLHRHCKKIDKET
jgi:hypothetical protein